MAQRKRPGATAKRERQARAEARKNAPILAKRREIEREIEEAQRRLAQLGESIFADENRMLRKRVRAHISRLQVRLNALSLAG